MIEIYVSLDILYNIFLPDAIKKLTSNYCYYNSKLLRVEQ